MGLVLKLSKTIDIETSPEAQSLGRYSKPKRTSPPEKALIWATPSRVVMLKRIVGCPAARRIFSFFYPCMYEKNLSVLGFAKSLAAHLGEFEA